MKPKVIILGHGYTSRLGVTRSVGKVGYPVVIIAMDASCKCPTRKGNKPVDYYSKYVSDFIFCPNNDDVLVNLLKEEFGHEEIKPILFPTSDFTAAAIDKHLDVLSAYFLFPHIHHKKDEIVRWMNKELQKSLAVDVGINVADGAIISINDSHFVIPETVKYPCFCKPLSTIEGAKHGLKRCDNELELKRNLSSLASIRNRIDVLVEDYLHIEDEYAIVGFSDGQNVIIPGVFHIDLMSGGGHFGVALQGTVLPSSQFQSILAKFSEYVKKIGFVGVFDIDFLYCNGRFYFDEMNMRIGGSAYALTKLGANIPVMMVDYFSKGVVEVVANPIESAAKYVNDRMCLDDWYHGNMTTKRFTYLLKESDITFVKDDDDEMPFVVFKREIRRTAIKRVLRKVYKLVMNK